MAVMKNSRGEIVAEQRVIVTNDGGLITTNTLYRDGCPVAQHVSVTDTARQGANSKCDWRQNSALTSRSSTPRAATTSSNSCPLR